jgi:putative sterol carrier protein
MTELRRPLERFVSIYHANPALVADQAGWHCSILLATPDGGERIGLRLADGRVTSIGDHDQRPDLIVTAPNAVLLEILELRRDPSEPYMFGELTVQGEERHFMRLDYVVTSLYPGSS